MDTATPYIDLEMVPKTYQEWLDCFSYIKVHPADYMSLRLLRQGSLICAPYILDKFLQRMDDTIGQILNFCISSFLSHVDQAFEEGDFDSVEILAIRFWERVTECFFFEDLDCIPDQYKHQFREGYANQLSVFWVRFLAELEHESEESFNFALEELMFQLQRLAPERIKKGMQA